jgi:adenosylcobinamide kinase/adenosylcobinamide-phosphate guanylyltransferase
MGQLTLILGGARSGKSNYAKQLAEARGKQVVYIATAEALDPEMQVRIEDHKKERPAQWKTLEIPRDVGRAIRDQPIHAEVVLLDCLTMLISNVLLAANDSNEVPDEDEASRAVEAEMETLLSAIQDSPADWIVVSNEVGMGLVPPYPLGRMYRDLLGKANQKLASAADEVYLLVAGIPIPLREKNPGDLTACCNGE